MRWPMIVQQAAVWPDLARKFPDAEREKYHRGPWHYQDLPLFLTPEAHVRVPLEATYRTAFDAVPRRWREVLEERRGQ